MTKIQKPNEPPIAAKLLKAVLDSVLSAKANSNSSVYLFEPKAPKEFDNYKK